MFRVRKERNGHIVLAVSGRIESADLSELRELIDAEKQCASVVLDLKDLTLVDRASVRFLGTLQDHGVRIVNCPLYITNWIANERNQVYEHSK